MTHRTAIVCCVLAGLLRAPMTPAQDEAGNAEETIDRDPVRCVPMGQIQSAVAANDRDILFYRSGGRIYLNILEQRCQGLQRNGLFTYRIRGGSRVARLCNSDSITVIDRATNTATLTCRLSVFHPVTEAQAEELLNFGRVPGNIVVTPVDLPPEEAAEKAEEAERAE